MVNQNELASIAGKVNWDLCKRMEKDCSVKAFVGSVYKLQQSSYVINFSELGHMPINADINQLDGIEATLRACLVNLHNI